MIVSEVIGGLGNQMFQYAAGLALAQARNQALLLDVSGFAGYALHQGFELQRVFGCPAGVATDAQLRSVLGWRQHAKLRRVLAKPAMASLRGSRLVVEPHYHYWPGLQRVPATDCYLAGYWQSEKYFNSIAPDVREAFAFKKPMEGRNVELAREIGQSNAVSIHVRRGDYAQNPRTTATHGLCSLDYYRAAIQHVSERMDTPTLYVFSDDIAWVRENMPMNLPCQFIDHNLGAESYNDMRLMSLCRHHVLANSSFSWWGAWLNPAPDKIVVAPRKWFANDNDVSDLFPPTWVTL